MIVAPLHPGMSGWRSPVRPSSSSWATARAGTPDGASSLHVDILAGRIFRDRIDGDGGLDGWLLAAGRGFVHLRPDGSVRSIAEVAPAGTRVE
jgi:hypothetical protein